MNDGYSVSTDNLRDAVSRLKTIEQDFRGNYKEDVEYLTIGRGDLPLFDGGFGSSYDSLQEALGKTCTSMADALEAVHVQLGKVVDKYEELEEQHGRGFDDANPPS